jgi:hypothetical protein
MATAPQAPTDAPIGGGLSHLLHTVGHSFEAVGATVAGGATRAAHLLGERARAAGDAVVRDAAGAARAVRERALAAGTGALTVTASVGQGVLSVATTVTDPFKDILEAEAARLEARLRARFNGSDDSQSAEKVRAKQLARYRRLYDALRGGGGGGVPINDLEDAFGLASLFEARTEVGRLSYEADEDGNGVLDFGEFTVVMDALSGYLSAQHGRSALAASIGGSFLYGTEGASLTARQVVWRTINEPEFSRAAFWVHLALGSAVLLAVGVFVAASVPALDDAHHARFAAVESACLAVFTVEYVLKLASAQPGLCAHLCSRAHALDVATLVPFFVDLAVEERSKRGDTRAAESPLINAIRIFRVLRAVKVARYVPYVSLMTASAAASAAPMLIALFILSIGTLLLAFSAYYTECGAWSDDAQRYVQPDGSASPFQSIAESMYWAVITLTTVGYGDLVPATAWGKIVGACTALAGTVIVAFPVSIYTEEFSHEYAELIKTKALQGEMAVRLACAREAHARAGRAGAGEPPADLVDLLLSAQRSARAAPALRKFNPSGRLPAALAPSVPSNLALLRRVRRSQVERYFPAASPRAGGGGGAGAPFPASPPPPPAAPPPPPPSPQTQPDLFRMVWTRAAARTFAVDTTAPEVAAWELGAPAARYDFKGGGGCGLVEAGAGEGGAGARALASSRLAACHAAAVAELDVAAARGGPCGGSESAAAAERLCSIARAATQWEALLGATQRPRGGGGGAEEEEEEEEGGWAAAGDGAGGPQQRARESGGSPLSSEEHSPILAPVEAEGLIYGQPSSLPPLALLANEPTALTAASFESYDLAADGPLIEAMTALLSDKRKQVWALVRALENRFRDDLTIECARRWAAWTAMQPEVVQKVRASPDAARNAFFFP